MERRSFRTVSDRVRRRAYGQIDLVHVNVADHDFEDVSKGWEKYYWAPWRKFLGQA